MTREEEIRQEIDLQLAGSFGNYDEGYEEGFIEGAKWADETMIEKAKKWIENFLEKTIQKPSINDGYTSDTIDWVELRRRRLIEEVLCDFKISNGIMKVWVCRDKYGWLTLHEESPFNNSGMWFSDNGTTHPYIRISRDCFPEVTFENSPQEVELVIKKKDGSNR